MEDPEPGPLFRALRPRRRRAVTLPHNPGAHGPGTGVFPTWAQVLSGLINFGPSLLVVVGLLLPLVFRAPGGDGGGQSGGSAKEVELPMVPTPLKRRTSKKYESLDEV